MNSFMRLFNQFAGWFSSMPSVSRRQQTEVILGIVYPTSDAVVLVASATAAFILHFKLGLGPDTPYRQFGFFYPTFVVYMIAFLLSGALIGIYRHPSQMSVVVRTYRLIGVSTLALLITIAAMYFVFSGRLDFMRVLLLYLWILVIIATVLVRTLLVQLVRLMEYFGLGAERVLLVGGGEPAVAVYELLANYPGHRYQVVGRLQNQIGNDLEVPTAVLGDLSVLNGVIVEHAIDKVVIAMPYADSASLMEIAAVCGSHRVTVWMLPDHFQLMVSMVGEEQLAGLPLMAVNDVRLKGVSRLTKRIVDVLVAAILLVVLSGPLLLVAIAVWLDSRGEIFFVQERMGHDGRRFPMIKFRSMRSDAEVDGSYWTIKDDPRVTTIGKILRRFSIDELPQLMNVLKGEMSLVGPRPERPEYVARFGSEYPRFLERYREKAGMSGWAQVNGLRGDVSISERVLYDLYYVENWSLGLDLRILMRTFVEVVRGRAY